jgi:ABC-type sugar transport system substrate-binding protein
MRLMSLLAIGRDVSGLRRMRTGCAAGALVLAALAPQLAFAQEHLSVGVVNFDSSAVAANQIAQTVVKEGIANGWDVVIQDPKADLGQANTLCSQYVTRQVDAIVVAVFQVSQMAQCLAYAKAASIPVFFLGTGLEAGAAGAISLTLAQPINDAFVDFLGKNKGLTVFAFTYKPGAPCREREELLDALLKKSNVSATFDKQEIVVPGIVTTSMAATQAWLNGHPDDGDKKLAIWACTSDAAFGALSAMKQAGRTGIPIYTWDMTDLIIDALKNNEMAATLWIDANGVAKQMVQQIRDNKAGKPPRTDEAAHLVITPENVQAFLQEHPNL